VNRKRVFAVARAAFDPEQTQHGWINTGKVGQDGYFVLDRHAIVTFTLSGVMDLQLVGFSIQNVVGGLVLRRAPDRP
jgi:hypothetical protein